MIIKDSQLIRYLTSGVANTAIGYIIILCAIWLGFNDYAANFFGYFLGLSFAFLIHKVFTFQSNSKRYAVESGRFVLAFVISYTANIVMLAALKQIGLPYRPVIQLISMATYSAVFYLIMKYWVFNQR